MTFPEFCDHHNYTKGLYMTSKFNRLLSASSLSTILMTCGFMAAAPVVAQSTEAAEPSASIVVTGSRIRLKALNSKTPLQIFTTEDFRRDGISSPEQLIATLNANGNGVDNLASQSDVSAEVSQRNINGSSSANLRGQGSGSTLVLLNGRRIATQGLTGGGAVDVNQLPQSAVSRVEILKDGASAIYGTDAIGGVINYILREDVQGLSLNAFSDVTEAGGGNISSVSFTGGYGDYETQGFNLMASASFRENEILQARDRDFVTTQDPSRGLAVDTRGTPYATIFPLANSIIAVGSAPFVIGSTTQRASGGINTLNLPGGLGCNAIADQVAYDSVLWANAAAQYACGYDTGRAGILLQPQESTNFLGRGVFKLGEHKLGVEFTGSKSTSARQFSEIQVIGGTGVSDLRYPSSGVAYTRVFNALQAAFGTTAIPESSRGLGINYRWRCMACGQRIIETESTSGRTLVTLEGPAFLDGWRYNLGIAEGFSEATSVTAGGYYYRQTLPALGVVGIRDVLRTGLINPFLLPGETQTAAGLALLKSAEARGIQIASGRSEVTSYDFSLDGPLFDLPAGPLQAAIGVDLREERYSFLGEARTGTLAFIEGAPIDSKPALADVSRDVKAVYLELAVPVLSNLDLSLAVRHDDYSGIGTTTNPKLTFRYKPFEILAIRGGYNTGFKAPTFTQLFDPVSTTLYQGADLTDPSTCPNGRVNTGIPACATGLTGINLVSGGKTDLQPEESEQLSLGFVLQPDRNLSFSVDWWSIERTDITRQLTLQELTANFGLFSDRFIRNSAGALIAVDQRTANAGGAKTEGFDLASRWVTSYMDGRLSLGMDGTFLTLKKEKLLSNKPYGSSLIGVFTFGGDLGLQWKHTAFATYEQGDWTGTLSQTYRSGYLNQLLPGVQDGSVDPVNDSVEVDPYVVYNLSLTYKGFKNITVTSGIKNLLDQDPPFAISYNSATGAGSSWEPRVADPRGRAFTLNLQYDF
jgi:iron complex outermembrane recepter protein